MSDLTRRGLFLGGAASLVGLAAPAIIRTPGLLMPVRALPRVVGWTLEEQWADGGWVPWNPYKAEGIPAGFRIRYY
jgi:hypothetical protein